MAGYKIQGETRDGSTVDLELRATYDSDGNKISEKYYYPNKQTGIIPADDLAGDIPASKVTGLADVATSGSYEDLINIPSTFPPQKAESGKVGGVKLGSGTVQSAAVSSPTAVKDRTYPLQLDNIGRAVVNVPWTDTVTAPYKLPSATASVLGGVKLGSNTKQTVEAQAVSSQAGRTYAVQNNNSGQLVVNVPWDSGGDGDTIFSAYDFTSLLGIANNYEAILKSGSWELHVEAGWVYIGNDNVTNTYTFKSPYNNIPFVVAAPMNFSGVVYPTFIVDSVSKTECTIRLKAATTNAAVYLIAIGS